MTDHPIPQAVTDDITADDKLWGLLTYLFPLIVSTLILLTDDKKNRPFLRYHAVQALVLGAAMFASTLILIGCCLSPFYLVGVIYLGIQAYNGEYVVIPILTDFCKQQKWL